MAGSGRGDSGVSALLEQGPHSTGVNHCWESLGKTSGVPTLREQRRE